MKIVGQIADVDYDYKTNTTKIVINADGDLLEHIEEFFNTKLNIEINKWYQKRKKEQNAYMWAMLKELQNVMDIPKEELYVEYLHRIGDYEVIPIKNTALNKFLGAWGLNGLGWFTETTPSRLKGYTNVLAYYGSSSYDTKQMSRLINLIKEDCRKFGIETRSEEDIKSLLGG